MVTQTQLSIRTATLADRQELASLLYFESYVHRHLDYRQPLDWIGTQPFLVIEENRKVVAALACPRDPPRVAWMRFFATSLRLPVETAWKQLWSEARAQLQQEDGAWWVSAIPQRSWFERLLTHSGFEETHRIVMMLWEGNAFPDVPIPPGLILRPMSLDDLTEVQKVDEASFVPVWQNSLTCLETAFLEAVIATSAELDGRLVGYQISTPTQLGGHLARLAVIPELQGRGIGQALVHDLLTQFERRGARGVSVNTQKNNLASLSLYRKMGFALSGEEYPIYQLELQ